MFMLFSLLAASVDGFLCGFAMNGIGIKLGKKEFFSSFMIIFVCCFISAIAGRYVARAQIDSVLNIIGGSIMLWLAVAGLLNDSKVHSSIVSASFAVAADASAACLYLAIYGYSPVAVAFVSAFLHSGLMLVANRTADKLIKPEWLTATRYMASGFFAIMAFMKFCQF